MSQANPGKRRLTEEEFRTITSLLTATDDEEDRAILSVVGRILTDDECERVRGLLAVQLMAEVLPDGSLTGEGKAIDEIIGKLMDY